MELSFSLASWLGIFYSIYPFLDYGYQELRPSWRGLTTTERGLGMSDNLNLTRVSGLQVRKWRQAFFRCFLFTLLMVYRLTDYNWNGTTHDRWRTAWAWDHHHSDIMTTEMSVTTGPGLYDRIFFFQKKITIFFIFTLVRVRPSRLAHQRQSTS